VQAEGVECASGRCRMCLRKVRNVLAKGVECTRRMCGRCEMCKRRVWNVLAEGAE
jgi:hypothetical protein